MSKTILTICEVCGMKERDAEGNKLPNPQSQALAQATTELLADTDIEVRLVRCLSLCDTPIAWGLRNEEKHATAFAPATSAEDLAATARAYAAHPAGTKLPKKLMPSATAATLISRIPPLD
jgi:predicted metal-binding protein